LLFLKIVLLPEAWNDNYFKVSLLELRQKTLA